MISKGFIIIYYLTFICASVARRVRKSVPKVSLWEKSENPFPSYLCKQPKEPLCLCDFCHRFLRCRNDKIMQKTLKMYKTMLEINKNICKSTQNLWRRESESPFPSYLCKQPKEPLCLCSENILSSRRKFVIHFIPLNCYGLCNR